MPGLRYAEKASAVTRINALATAALSHSLRMPPFREGLLVDREVDQCREHAETDGSDESAIVRPGGVVEVAGEPDADEAADLVTQEHDRREHRGIAHAEDLADEAVGERYRSE